MQCDVLISGGGLAGLSAARCLSGSGLDVVVAEMKSPEVYRRYHTICGEAVSDRMFSLAGMEPRAVVRRVDTITISFAGKSDIRIPVRGSIIDRNLLLDSMGEESEARFLSGKVDSISRTEDGFRVTVGGTEVSCRYLIGADGAHSAVRKQVFGSVPQETISIVNNIVRGEGDGSLRFTVSDRYPGAYRWDFPSKEGFMSVGYPHGTEHIEDAVSTGGRIMPIGRLPAVVDGNCLLTGDAGCLANPLCFGGIGAALVSGRRAAEAVIRGRPGEYQKWVDRDIMFDDHFMAAHRQFVQWADDEIVDAMGPLTRGYSVWNGFKAMVRRPSYANLYFSCWVGFRRGW